MGTRELGSDGKRHCAEQVHARLWARHVHDARLSGPIQLESVSSGTDRGRGRLCMYVQTAGTHLTRATTFMLISEPKMERGKGEEQHRVSTPPPAPKSPAGREVSSEVFSWPFRLPDTLDVQACSLPPWMLKARCSPEALGKPTANPSALRLPRPRPRTPLPASLHSEVQHPKINRFRLGATPFPMTTVSPTVRACMMD